MWFRKKQRQTSGSSSQSQTDAANRSEVLRKLSPAATNASQAQPWNDSSSADLSRSRKKMNKFLRRMGRSAKQDLSLDGRGICTIPFKKFLIRVEVPVEDPFMVHVHAMVFEVLNARHSRNLNYIDTMDIPKGINVALNGPEVNLSYAAPVSKLNYNKMLQSMETFMQTAVDVNSILEGQR